MPNATKMGPTQDVLKNLDQQQNPVALGLVNVGRVRVSKFIL